LTTTPDSCKIQTTTTKGSKMATLTVGSQFTTLKSGVEGTIEEIVENDNGSVRLRLMTSEGTRWTTVK
jgi:hypothetical protein